jgi:hypothetical protein
MDAYDQQLVAISGAPSPDGLGYTVEPLGYTVEPLQETSPSPWVEAPTPAMPMQRASQPRPQMGGYRVPVDGVRASWLEGGETQASNSGAMRSAGVISLFALAAGGVGLALGGGLGGVSGVLLAGAAVNGYRSQKWWGTQDASQQHEVMTSLVFSVLGAGAGIYSGYLAYHNKGKLKG